MEERVFERYLLLGYEKRAGVIRGIYDADGQPL